MPRGQAVVRTGLIGPEADPRETPSQDILAERVARSTSARPASPSEVVFHAKARNYMFQVKAPAPIFDPATGRLIEGRPVAAKFQNGEFRTKDPEVIEILKSNVSYGIGRDFWDAAELVERNRENNKARLLEQMKADPELARELISQLSPSVQSFAAQPSA